MQAKPWKMLLVMLAGWINRQQQEAIEYLKEENRILREKLGGKRILLTDRQRRRLAILGKRLGRELLGQVCCAFSPDTLLKWHRKLVAKKYDGSKNRSKYGRPRISDELKQLIIDMARDHKHLGCRKLHGYLKYLGLKVSSATISRVLREHGIEPSPLRPERTSWNEFIKAHWESLAAIDFFSVEVYTVLGLTRYMVLFSMQMARNLTDPFDGFLKDKKYLVTDRDPLFTKDFRMILKAVGIKTVKTSVASPNLNPFAERFVRSIKSECLNKMLIFGERHLRYVIENYVDHYHTERPHQGIGNNIIEPPPQGDGRIVCHERLGGLLKCWRRAA